MEMERIGQILDVFWSDSWQCLLRNWMSGLKVERQASRRTRVSSLTQCRAQRWRMLNEALEEKKIKRSASATLSLRFLRDIKIEMSKSLRAPEEDWVECKFGDSIYMLVRFRARVLPGITPGKRERKEKYRPTIQRTPRFSADGRKKPLQETIEK